MTKKKYPQHIYFDMEGEGHGRFNTCTEPRDMTGLCETNELGEYELKRMVRIVNATTVEPVKPKKKAAKKRGAGR